MFTVSADTTSAGSECTICVEVLVFYCITVLGTFILEHVGEIMAAMMIYNYYCRCPSLSHLHVLR